MKLTLSRPATLLDMAAINGSMTPVMWDVAREMWRNGETMAFHAGDQLIGVFGIYPAEDGVAEAWFNIKPEGRRFMGFLCRRIQLTLASLHYPEIVVFCDTEAGRRIAAICGFEFALMVEGKEVWRYGHVRRRFPETGFGAAEAAAGIEPEAAARRPCPPAGGD